MSGFKRWEPPIYTLPQKHPLGSIKIGDLDPSVRVDDVAFEYFCEVVKKSDSNAVGLISTLHENWCLEAAGDWYSAAGENCCTLADLAQKALDAISAGYIVEIPRHLTNVDRSSYRRRSSPAVMASNQDVFTACVLGLEDTVKADTLEEALKIAHNLVGVRAIACSLSVVPHP